MGEPLGAELRLGEELGEVLTDGGSLASGVGLLVGLPVGALLILGVPLGLELGLLLAMELGASLAVALGELLGTELTDGGALAREVGLLVG